MHWNVRELHTKRAKTGRYGVGERKQRKEMGWLNGGETGHRNTYNRGRRRMGTEKGKWQSGHRKEKGRMRVGERCYRAYIEVVRRWKRSGRYDRNNKHAERKSRGETRRKKHCKKSSSEKIYCKAKETNAKHER